MLAFLRSNDRHRPSPCALTPAYVLLLLLLSFLGTPASAFPTSISWPNWRRGVPTPPPTDPPCDDDHIPWTDFQKRNFKTISGIYNATVYPNQMPIITQGGAGVPPGLFSKKVLGRVDPVGDFRGFEDSIEYFFALAPFPESNPLKAAITGYKITEFTSQCADVAASVVHLFCSVVNPGGDDDGKELPALKQVAFWKFDSQGDVLKYDALIPNLNAWVVRTLGVPVWGPPEYQLQSIIQICAVTMMRCQGPNQQWESLEQCVGDLSQRPYGNYDEAWGDNIVCRSIHLVLTQVRPDHHCPHVGPTGGGKCIEVNYPDDYFNDQELFGDPLGETFMCKK